MTPRLPRSLRLATGAVLAALALSACGEGPVRAGAAATVGEARIETEQLVQVVERGLAAQQEAAGDQAGAVDRGEFQRGVLSRLIQSRVRAEAARREGVEVSEGDVAELRDLFEEQSGGEEQLLQEAAAAGIAEEDLAAFFRDFALGEALGDALVAGEQVDPATLRQLYEQQGAQYDQVVARHILVEDRALAEQLLAQVQEDADRFGELAEENSLDTGSAQQGGQLPPAGRGDYVAPFEEALFRASEGEIGLVETEFGFHVYQLLERNTTTLEDATPELRRTALAEQRQEALVELQRDVAADLRIRVNPRFGTWDLEQLTVVPADSDLSVPEPDPGLDDPGAGLDPEAPEPVQEVPGEEVPGEAPVEPTG